MNFFLKISVFFLILILGITGIAIYHTFYNLLPDQSATINSEFVNQTVDIHWDPYGVPYVDAQSEDDLYFATGFLHAQDRLWQLTLSQLMAEGRFSEYLGSDFIELDRHQRTLGIWRTAKKIKEASPDSLLHMLQRYADGVNEYIAQNPNKLPIELTILGLEPPRWTPIHSIAVSRLMAWDQNIHWKSEIILAQIGAEIGANRLNQLFPDQDHSYISVNNQYRSTLESLSKTILRNEKNAERVFEKQGSATGSNAWAISSRLRSTRQPLLAGDPHMSLSMPGFWYEMGQSLPEHEISGATMPGAPFIILGQNRSIAWSITNMMADDTDFFLIQEDSFNNNRYVVDSLNNDAVFDQYTWQEEIIKVADVDDYYHRIPHTRFGPVVNSVHQDSSLLKSMPVAMKWAGHDVSHELWSIYKLNKASNLDQFTSALTHFGSPAMNFIYADSNDNIALIGAGNLPVRNGTPILFRESWNPNHRWMDWIPFDELPGEVNPERGYVAHANNYHLPENYPYYIGRFWAPESRISRIRNLIEGSDNANSEQMKQIQNDIYSVHAEELMEILLPMIRSSQVDNEFETALTYLQNWNYQYSRNSTAASIFDLFFMNLSELVLKRVIPEEYYGGLIRLEYIPVNMVHHILSDGSSFFNIVEEESINFREETIREAMRQTLNQLTDQLGSEPFEWRWESMHTLTLRPPLLGEISGHPDAPNTLKLIVNNLLSSESYPVPGHGMTINKGEYSWNDPFDVTLGPSIRRIIDFSSPSRSLSVLPTGQSGRSLSSNYGDQTDLWLNGRYRYIYSDSTFFNETNYNTMKLEPLSVQ